MTEELEQLRKKLRENSLGISRLDKETKLKFMEMATHFCDDYGQTLQWCLVQAIEYQEAKKVFFKIYELEGRMNDIEANLSKLSPKEEIKEEIKKQVKTLGSK